MIEPAINIRRASRGDFTSPLLVARAETHRSEIEDLVLLRAERDGVECGLLVLDSVSDDTEVELTEIFVLPELRGTGLGTQLLAAAEQFARNEGRAVIVLHAEPLDDEDDDAKPRLIEWYCRRGYRHDGAAWDDLTKKL